MSTHDSPRGRTRQHRRGNPSILVRSAAVFGGLLLALCVAAPAFAHAELVSSTPDDKAVLETPPTTITLTFSEGLDAGKSSFKLVGGGATVGTGKADADGDTAMTLDGLALPPGAYEIKWTSAATDGHIARGTLTFTVAEPTPAPPTPTPAVTPNPAAAPTGAPSVAVTPEPTGAHSAAPTAAPAVTPAATPAPTADAGTSTAASTADVLIPIVVGLIAVAGVGAYVMRRSRGA